MNTKDYINQNKERFLNELLEFHKNHGKMVTVTAVHPAARFGELLIEKGEVKLFKEKHRVNK